jgi:hypothetical protein
MTTKRDWDKAHHRDQIARLGSTSTAEEEDASPDRADRWLSWRAEPKKPQRASTQRNYRNMNHGIQLSKAQMRKQIDRTVSAFMVNGGAIKFIPCRQSGIQDGSGGNSISKGPKIRRATGKTCKA